MKFRENPFSGSRFVPDGQTNMTELMVAFRNFADAYKNPTFCMQCFCFVRFSQQAGNPSLQNSICLIVTKATGCVLCELRNNPVHIIQYLFLCVNIEISGVLFGILHSYCGEYKERCVTYYDAIRLCAFDRYQNFRRRNRLPPT